MRRSASTSAKLQKRLTRRRATNLGIQKLEDRRLLAVSASTPDFVLPEDADVIDVTSWSDDPLLNADPAAGNNDHFALQSLLDTVAEDPGRRTKIIYFPEGEYEVDQALIVPLLGSNNASARVVLQGQSRDRVLIRLSDDSNVENAVVRFQIRQAADAFRNAVRDLTIDVGAGNPAADGLRFVGSNQATVRNVNIRSSDPGFAGRVGLELGRIRNDPNRGTENISSGPLLIENVGIDGFDVGIRTGHQVASQTFEDIELTNQQVFGWINETNQNVFARNVTSLNEVRAIQNAGGAGNGVFTLLDSQLTGVGIASGTNAIFTEERLYARNVDTSGYGSAIDYQPSGEQFPRDAVLSGTFVEEYWSEGAEDSNTGGAAETFEGSPDAMLGLPVQDSPEPPLDLDLANWASPHSFVTSNADGTPSGLPGDQFDDAAAIQAAIDSGATTIYFQNAGDWVIDDAVEIRGSVERLLGLESILVTRSGDGVVRIGNTSADAVVIERFDSRRGQRVGFDHVSDQTVVARNMIGFDYEPVSESPGDVFLYDIAAGTFTFRNQNVWGRQLNPEGAANVNDQDLPDQKILNDNANVWILGMKVETEGTIFRTINGGQTELYGLYRNNATSSDADNPAFVTVDASLSVANFDSASSANNAWAVHASETRSGITQTIERIDSTIYTAFDDATLWDVRRDIILDNLDEEVTFQGEWLSSATKPGGYIDSDIAFSDDPNASARFSPTLPVSGQYDVFVRWIGESRRKSDHKGHSTAVPLQINHSLGSENLTLDQTRGGGKWVKVGTYFFDAGTNGSVVLGTNPGSNSRKTIADGVRFSLNDASGEVPDLRTEFQISAPTRTINAGVFSGGEYTFNADQGLIFDATDAEGRQLFVTEVQQGIGGTIAFSGDGAFTYSPQPWFSGWDILRFSVTNGTNTTTGYAQIFVADSFDASTGTIRRELTPAELVEANAQVIDSVRAESSNGGFIFRMLDTARNGSGIGAQPGHSRTNGNDHFLGVQDAAPVLDLGDTYELKTLRLWNYNVGQVNGITDRLTTLGVKTLQIYVDPDSDNDAFGENFILAKTIELPEAPGRTDYSGNVFVLDGVQARYVRIEAISNHGSNISSGLSDLEFRGTLVKSAKSSLIETISVASASSERDSSSSAPRTLGSGFFSGSNVHDSRQRSGNWESADGDSTPSITYDLGKQHDLGSIRIWNYNYRFATERGAKLVNVFVSDDNEDFVRVKTIELEEGPGSDDYTGEKFELDGIEARYLKLQILESHGASGNVGLAHVSVYGSAISDAPSSVSLSTTSDTGRSDQDGITRLSNADAGQTLQFVVDGTEADDVVTVFANGIAIGSSVASGSSTNVTTDGKSVLIDGAYEITAVRTSPGEMTSASTPAVMIQIDATNPTASFTPPGGGLEFEKIGIQFDEAVFGLGLEDIVVARNGEQLTTSETVLEMVDATEFYLSGLKSITNDAGLYTLSSASASDATDEAGNPASFDEAIETVARTRAFNQRSRNFSIIPHEDVELLEAGEIAFSFRADQTSGTLFSKDHIGFGNGGHLTIRLRNRRVEVRLQSDEMSYYVRSGNISAGRDYDVVFRFGPNGMQLVLNGNLVDSNAYSGGLADATGTTTNFEDIVIGASKVRSDQGTNNNLRDFFTGRMTDLRIADGNGRLLFSESVIPYEFGAGETNFFNGVDQFVEVSHQEEQELANGAFELTFNTSDASQRQTLFSKDNSGFDSGGHITASMIDGRIEIRLQSDSESYYVYSNLIASGTDYALRFEFGDGGMRLFLDGVLVDQNAYDGGLQGNENALVIAASTRKSRDDADRLEYHFNGRLTDFKMFDSGGIAIDLFGNDDDDEDA